MIKRLGVSILIYRIHPNIKHFLMLHLDGDKARAALGEDTDFYMDERPIPYAVDWQVMEVDFQDAYGAGEKLYPDISANVGKLFLSERAYATFKDLLAGLGEFLPVRYADQKGYVFNCLKTVSAVGELSVHDPLNDRFSAAFDNSADGVVLYKSDTDLNGHFCSEVFRKVVLENGLTGVCFSEDLGNPFPEELGMKVSH